MRRSPNRGQGNGNAKVTPMMVREIRRARKDPGRRAWPKAHPNSLTSLAARFGLSVSQVSKIALARQWGHL